MLGALLAALLVNPPATADVPVITPEQAMSYVGQDVVVQGYVSQVGVSEDGDTLFLDFGGRYPDHVFNAVIFSPNQQAFPEARSWEGKIIKVSGKIQLYKGSGKPEIILERQEQVTIDSSTARPQGAVPEGTEVGVEGGVIQGTPRGVQGGVLGGTGTSSVMDYDSPPRPIKITRPLYPKEAFAKKVEGTVVVEILIDSQGRVVRARVIQSVPLLDAAALETVYQWIFQPAVKHGRPVPTIAHAPVRFRIYATPEQRVQRVQRPATPPATPAPAPSGETSHAAQRTGENLGGLYFDPQGADFTLWVQHFKDEVYRNWLLPQAVSSGFKGHVDLEITVERDGTMSALRMLRSSGSPPCDRAAQNALSASHLMVLPKDYKPARVTMQVNFFYNEAPSGPPKKNPE